MIIRDARVEEVPVILEMLQESAEEQGFPESLAVTEADLAADGFGAAPRFYVSIAEVDGVPAGMALYFFNYSTWGSRDGLYLEDLYVDRAFRKRGVARALMVRLAQIAQARGCGRFQWVVHAANASAVRMYESIGAEMLTDWRLMSLKGDGIARLAAGRDNIIS
jgi:GNAT superfamily N-acetyltransferase